MTLPKTILFALVLTGFLMISPALADESNKGFCDSDPGFKEWDFWVGEWKVTSMSNGTYLGRNTIKKTVDGCLLIEDWHGLQNAKGQSMNYYNPRTKTWRQLWIDNGGHSIDYEGRMVDGSMMMEGKFHKHSDGTTQGFRGIWTPLEGGAVRQVFEFQNDEDGTWSVQWDARYERISKSEHNPGSDL